MYHQPAHHGIEDRIRERIVQGIAAKMRDALAQAAALCEICRDLVQARLQFERGDMAARRVRQEARRPTDARADIEDPADGPEVKLFRRAANRLGPLIGPLVQRKQLLRRDRILGTNAEGGKSFVTRSRCV